MGSTLRRWQSQSRGQGQIQIQSQSLSLHQGHQGHQGHLGHPGHLGHQWEAKIILLPPWLVLLLVAAFACCSVGLAFAGVGGATEESHSKQD